MPIYFSVTDGAFAKVIRTITTYRKRGAPFLVLYVNGDVSTVGVM